MTMTPGVAARAGISLIRQAIMAYITNEKIEVFLEIGEER